MTRKNQIAEMTFNGKKFGVFLKSDDEFDDAREALTRAARRATGCRNAQVRYAANVFEEVDADTRKKAPHSMTIAEGSGAVLGEAWVYYA